MMKEFQLMKMNPWALAVRLLPALAAAALAWPVAALAQTAAVDPEALKMLRRSTDYIASTKQFSLDNDSSIEVVLNTGQKLQLDHRVALTVQRPDKMYAERVGELISQSFSYDGKSLSVNLPDQKVYATATVPPTIDGMLDMARDKLDVVAPGADLVYANAYQRLTDGLTSAFVVGKAFVGGARCDHIAFRNAEVDWQIWIQDGDLPLPRKFVITSKRMPGSPQFSSTLSNWNLAPNVSAATFAFTPPAGAQRIEFLPVSSPR
jgi:hypothetical protein